MANKIFVSYSRKDEFFARALAYDLEESGAEIWIDVDDIPVGVRWSSAIQTGLRESNVLLLVMSPSAMASNNVEDEWNYFLDKKKPIIAVYWRSCDPHFQLWRAARVEFRPHKQSYGAAFKELITALEAHQVYLTPPATLPSTQHSFIRKALGRAIDEALKAEAEHPRPDSTLPESAPISKPSRPHPSTPRSRRPLLIFTSSLVLAILLICMATFLRLERDREEAVEREQPSQTPTLSPNPSQATASPIPPTLLPHSPTPIPPTSATISPPTLELVYNLTTVYLRNISELDQDVSRLSFRQENGIERLEFDAITWRRAANNKDPIYTLNPQHCFQVGTSVQDARQTPEACSWLDAWEYRGARDFYFWLPLGISDTFTIYWDQRPVTSCSINAGFCEFSLDAVRR